MKKLRLFAKKVGVLKYSLLALCFAQPICIIAVLCSEQTKIHRRQLVVRSVGISNRCGSTGLGQQISCVVIGVGGCRGSRRARGLFP